MEKFIKQLRNIIVEHKVSCSCFAIDTKLKVGIKIGLSSKCINDFLVDCLNYLCDREFLKMQLGEYPIATPKDFVETIESTDDKISSTLSSLLLIPVNVETNVTDLSKYKAYMLVIETSKSKYYFLTKRTPFISYKKKNFFFAMFSNNDYKILDDNVIRLVKHFDCIIIENTCYMIGMNGRTLLGLNNIAKDNSLKNKERLIQEGIISRKSASLITSYMNKPGKAQCLSEVNENLMNLFGHINADNKKTISERYRLKIIEETDGKFYIDVSDEKNLEDLIATLTNKRGKNFDNETVETKSPFITKHP